MFQKTLARLAESAPNYVGATGSYYRFRSMIQKRPYMGRVWLAVSGQDKYILKDIPRDIYDNFIEDIRPRWCKSDNIRLPCDSISGQRIFVYKYMTDDFLSLGKRGISTRAQKQFLNSSLFGIAELHEQQVVHLGRCIKGMLAGNDNWRSPEAHFKGELNKPTDMFAFGIIVSALPAMIHLQRQVSYFGDKEGLNGLLKHIGDDEVSCQVLRILWDERAEDYIPYKPFAEWEDLMEPEFKDFIEKLMNLDPAKRVTAREVLEHPWFSDV
ncbi:hypothetical protein ASPBRDRAFT_59233 [Aspergillus brasiliensis CBS 101740]|uniref:Protein kinase domain-containing protein n=1 Tax=Aspergillus brasiliensis (strain CBS 101740 / IMI 381727 / IBT 21946) TaxID=767769 RepID=A0A1L9U6G3_ASPBC|nr:hypothetical protein ASPBRDRAFT_59233 [Aspergillus brasiliensis CBS 101740]